MKFTKLFLMTAAMVFAFDATAEVKRDASWRKDITDNNSYDEEGYKGSDPAILVGVACGTYFKPVHVKLVNSYEGLIAEIKKTISHSSSAMQCLQTQNLNMNNLELWDRDGKQIQTTLTGISPRSRWLFQ
jgi:hypothetical protein